jgi:hypothetical protein
MPLFAARRRDWRLTPKEKFMHALKKTTLAAAVALLPVFAFAQGSTTTPAPSATPAPAATPATPSTTPAKPAKGEHAHKRGERMKAADKDGDGAISKSEAEGAKMTRLSKNFDAIDTNKDGKVTKEEMAAYRKAHKGEHKGSKGGAKAPAATPAAPATATPAPTTPAK